MKESRFPIPSTKIYGFYHICCLGNWKDIVKSQIDNLVNSPLYEILDTVYVCIIVSDAKNADLEFCNEVFPKKINIAIVESDLRVFEYPILKLIKLKSESEDFYGFYFHAKGVSVNKKKRGVVYWRKEMEYFLFHKCDLMINAFKQDYNTYGANIRTHPRWTNVHFSGNFWFAKSSYIKTLPPINPKVGDRHLAEEWIGKGEDMKAYAPFNTFISLYHIPLPRLFYNKSTPIKFKDIWELCLFGYYKIYERVIKSKN